MRTDFFRRHLKRMVAILLIVGLYGFTRLPELSKAERSRLASQFRFSRQKLPELQGQRSKSFRVVHPGLDRISAWISSVGAAVALNDLDGDGLPNDICYVDPRTDLVIVAPAPGTPQRYAPFALKAAPLPYDSEAMVPMGCLVGDLNEDGLRDVLVYYWERTPIAFLRKGELTPGSRYLTPDSFARCEIVSGIEPWNTNAATMADLDGDGHIDLVIGNYFQDGVQLLGHNATSNVQMQHSMSRAYNGGADRILLWKGATAGPEPTVQFEEAKGVFDAQVAHGWALAVGTADLDGDLRPEIYIAHDFGPDRLLHNQSTPGHPQFAILEGRKGFTTPSSKVLGHDSFKGMGVDFGDLNGDGLLDIYVSNIAAEYALEESHFAFVSTGKIARMRDGIAPYVEESETLGLSRSGWGWESRLADFNNDGVLEAIQATGFVKGTVNRWPELHELAMGNDELLSHPKSWPRFRPGDDLSGHQHNPFFVRAKDGRYYDLAREIGLGEPMVTRGIATADVDGDGDLDFAVANQWETSYLYLNESPNPGTFLGLHLLLPVHPEASAKVTHRSGHPGNDTPASPAIGAAATVHLPNGKSLVAQVDGGNGHSGARSPDLLFGLGPIPRDTQLQVDLHWRDRGGHIHQDTLYLQPGWSTVMLGGSIERRID